VRGFIFVEEIMKSDFVIAFASSAFSSPSPLQLARLRSPTRPGGRMILSLKASHNMQLLAPNALSLPVWFLDWGGYRLVPWQHLFSRQVPFRRVDSTAA
jgi:hypothetical protein